MKSKEGKIQEKRRVDRRKRMGDEGKNEKLKKRGKGMSEEIDKKWKTKENRLTLRDEESLRNRREKTKRKKMELRKKAERGN